MRDTKGAFLVINEVSLSGTKRINRYARLRQQECIYYPAEPRIQEAFT